ncbi:MAG: DUF2612 domain-containing protein [Sporomusaceae bacterium]|nr:DUF2612 domain-containing protein [Sporomusaceae bacterium]
MALKDRYLNLISSQHRDKPKYMAMLSALMQPSEDIFAVGVYLDDEFDIDNAVGKQQDILGHIVGQERTLPFQPARGLSPVLDNYAYRQLLKAKIAKNTWKGRVEDLKETWLTLFGKPIIIQDNQDMTIDVVVVGLFDQIVKDMILNGLIVPKPQSVGVNYAFADEAVFGYDMETASIKGYDHADWMNPNPVDSFAYDTDNDEQRMFGYNQGYWT